MAPTPQTVAVLSDVHGVLPALEAVLAEPDVRAADTVVLTGDLVAGPFPRGILRLLDSLGDRARILAGNAERELLAYRAAPPAGPPATIGQWAAALLTDAEAARLEVLPARLELPVAGIGRVLFCHATPRDDTEVVLVDSHTERWDEVLSGVGEEVSAVVCGHTHMPFVRLVGGRLLVDPGSVGMPYGREGAHWALLGPGDSVAARRTRYDVDAACARVAHGCAWPGAAEWADEYLRARNSAEDALAAFGPLDGRPVRRGERGL